MGARHRISRLRGRHPGRRHELGQRTAPGGGHLERRRLRCDRLRRHGAGYAGGRNRGSAGAHGPTVRRQPDHHASAARSTDPGLSGGGRWTHRAGRWDSAWRCGAGGEGWRREADRLHPGTGAGKAAYPVGCRRAGDRGIRSRWAYRSGVADGAGTGDPAAYPRGTGLRCGWAGSRRGNPRVAGDGRLRSAARHPLRRRHRVRSRIQTSSVPSSGPPRATRCLRCNWTSAFR